MVTQQVGQEPLVSCGRYSVHDVERGHPTTRSLIEGCLVGRQIVVVHGYGIHAHGIIVASGFGCSVQGKVLYTCQEGIGFGEVVTLKSPDHCPAYAGAEAGVFSCTFGNTPPSRVAADVDHRRECPVDTECGCFVGCDPCALFQEGHVPAACTGQGYGENRIISVNDIEPCNQRYLHARIFYGKFLGVFGCFGIEPSDRTDKPFSYGFVESYGTADHFGAADSSQIQLPDFFFQRHLLHQ